MQPHRLGSPPPPHVSGASQLPQPSVELQPSSMLPHSAPSCEQVVGVQPHRLGSPPPPHVSGASQLPQSSVDSQPSLTVPHSAPRLAQVSGSQGVAPHRLGPSPPQTSGGAQSPQSRREPQPSPTSPHSAPSSSQVCGTQTELSSAASAAPSDPPWASVPVPESGSALASDDGVPSVDASGPLPDAGEPANGASKSYPQPLVPAKTASPTPRPVASHILRRIVAPNDTSIG